MRLSMRTMMTMIVAAFGTLDASRAMAATIMVTSTADNTVGQSIVYNLRNQVSRSSLHKLVYTKEDAGFVIRIVTLKENDGRSAAYAAVLTMPPLDKKGLDYYLGSQVGYCGANVTERCAGDILAGFDQDITDVVSSMTEILNKKPQ